MLFEIYYLYQKNQVLFLNKTQICLAFFMHIAYTHSTLYMLANKFSKRNIYEKILICMLLLLIRFRTIDYKLLFCFVWVMMMLLCRLCRLARNLYLFYYANAKHRYNADDSFQISFCFI